MPFAIHLFFDLATEATIQATWKALADHAIAPYMHHSGNRPHLTLAIYHTLPLEETQRRLATLASAIAAQPVTFAYLGTFRRAGAVVFVAPTVTPALLALHAEMHTRFAGIAGTAERYYLPGSWVPHCTLALEFPPQHIPAAVDLGLQLPLPLEGQITEVGVIEFRPVKHLFGYRLGS